MLVKVGNLDQVTLALRVKDLDQVTLTMRQGSSYIEQKDEVVLQRLAKIRGTYFGNEVVGHGRDRKGQPFIVTWDRHYNTYFHLVRPEDLRI